MSPRTAPRSGPDVSLQLAELLTHTARRLRRGSITQLAPLGLTYAQARVLRLAASDPPAHGRSRRPARGRAAFGHHDGGRPRGRPGWWPATPTPTTGARSWSLRRRRAATCSSASRRRAATAPRRCSAASTAPSVTSSLALLELLCARVRVHQLPRGRGRPGRKTDEHGHGHGRSRGYGLGAHALAATRRQR